MENLGQPHGCPICLAEVCPNKRYPKYLCSQCSSRATDAFGRSLEFGNVGLSGGYVAAYADTGEEYPSHECFVDGIRCRADEARFGGIVIETWAMD
jgi:hypothetical protein